MLVCHLIVCVFLLLKCATIAHHVRVCAKGGLNGLAIIHFEGIDRNVAPKNFDKVSVGRISVLCAARKNNCGFCQAQGYFAAAAEQHHTAGMYNTALLSLHGPPGGMESQITGRDFKKALNLFSKSAQRGHVSILFVFLSDGCWCV